MRTYVRTTAISVLKEITSKKTNTELKDEWLEGVYPSFYQIRNNSESIVDSLVRRIRVRGTLEAEKVVADLVDSIESYEISQRQFTSAENDFKKHIGMVLDPLDFNEKKVLRNEKKQLRHCAYTNAMQQSANIPNILGDIDYTKRIAHTLSTTLKAPNLKVSIDNDSYTNDGVRLSYLVGEAALLELELTDYTASFLDSGGFTPITVPSFIRDTLVEKVGFKNESMENVYTLLTKQEMHMEADNPFRKVSSSTRKVKSEDQDVFHVTGLTELSMVGFFIRNQISHSGFPVQISSVGNRYHVPIIGESAQSRVAMFVTATERLETSNKAYLEAISFVESFWKSLDFEVEMRVVEAHNLLSHEAAAVMFVSHDKKTGRAVTLSRVSTSYDYLSRRLMARGPTEFCHFVSCELININTLLDLLKA